MVDTTRERPVLIVEDDRNTATLVATYLEREGFATIIAGDGQQALECVREELPDLISLDLVMPKRSGMKFYGDLQTRPEWKQIPVLIVTGHARDDLGREDFQALTVSGPGFYLEKPVKPQDYVGAVRKMLGMTPEEVRQEEDLRKELANVLASADADALREALDAIKKKRS